MPAPISLAACRDRGASAWWSTVPLTFTSKEIDVSQPAWQDVRAASAGPNDAPGRQAPAPRPSQDPFYAPVSVPVIPGETVRSRRVCLPGTVPARAWQLVYGSRDTHGRSRLMSGTVLVPRAPWHGGGPRPLLGYAVGIRGLGRDAAPGNLMRRDLEPERPIIEAALARGWIVAVPDGDGLGMPGPHTYGAGRPNGHGMLDLARAAIATVPECEPAAPMALWGYSSGGRAAIWAAELHPAYAPELRLTAVAAGGIPTDLYQMAKAVDGGPFSGLGLAVLIGLAHAHDDPRLWDILTPAGRQVAARAELLDAPRLIMGHPEPMSTHTVRENPWDEPTWRAVLASELTGQRTPQVPVYLYHVHGDELVPTEMAAELAATYVADGGDVTWRAIRAANHLEGAAEGAGEALTWLAARLSGVAAGAVEGPAVEGPVQGVAG